MACKDGKRAEEGQPWRIIVDFLEEYELNKEKPRRNSSASVWFGCLLSVVGIGGLLAALIYSSTALKFTGNSLYPFVLVISVLLFLVGVFVCLNGISSGIFLWISKFMGKYSRGVLTLFQFSTLVLTLGLDVLLFLSIVNDDFDWGWQSLATISALLVALVGMVLVVGSGPIAIGVIKVRSGVGARENSILIEGATLLCPMLVLVAVVGWSREGIALMLSLALALVAYLKYRTRRLDVAFREAIEYFDSIRGESLSYLKVPRGSGESRNSEAIYASYRRLHRKLISSPAAERRIIRGFGLNALCTISEMRHVGERDCRKFLSGAHRIKAGERCLGLSEEGFALGSVQVFDAMLRLLDGSFAPQGRRKARATLEQCLTYHAIFDPQTADSSYCLARS